MRRRVVVLGGGVGGTLVANLVDRELGHAAEVTVVDPTGMHVYQPGFLYVALGQANAQWLARDERTLLRRAVGLAVETATRVDTARKEVAVASGGSLPYDDLVIATGARTMPELVPGAAGVAHDFYSLAGAQRLREALRRFRGGRIVVGIAGVPYKCPPAPVEFTLMLEDALRARGLRRAVELTFLSPIGRALSVEPASTLVQPIMEARGIALRTFFNVETVDAAAGVVRSLEGEDAPFDLLILVPPHRGQEVVTRSGLADGDGWVPTDRTTLAHRTVPGVYALGDATDLPISKSGSTAHFEAPVVASRIAATARGTEPKEAYAGRVMCFVETGRHEATALRFDYAHPPVPPRPSLFWHAAKWAFNRAYWHTVPLGRMP